MAGWWDNIGIKKGKGGCGDVTVEQKNSLADRPRPQAGYRVHRLEEGVRGLPLSASMHEKPPRPFGSPAPPPRDPRCHALRTLLPCCPCRYCDEKAPHGALVCPKHSLWLCPCPLARTLEGAYPGVSRINRPKHRDAHPLCNETDEGSEKCTHRSALKRHTALRQRLPHHSCEGDTGRLSRGTDMTEVACSSCAHKDLWATGPLSLDLRHPPA